MRGEFRVAVLVVAAAEAAVLTGCCAKKTQVETSRPMVSDVLFSGEMAWSGADTFGRAEWPQTTVFDSSGEEIEYREILHDLQSRSFGGRDWYYRRFESVRTGRRER